MRKLDAPATSGTYRFGLFRLEARGTGLARLDDDGTWMPVAIGSRALDLLSLLLRRHGEVLTRDEIMDAVWPGVAVEESNLTVQIAALRRALDLTHSGPSCIQTISGRGYRFVPTVTMEGDAAVVDPFMPAHAAAPDRRRPLSLIVVPFSSDSGDDDSDSLADTITDELTSDLSRLPGAVVIAHRSVGASETALLEARASYLIRGSVRGVADRTRVNVQLIDMATGAHVWAEWFDADRAATAEGRDEIAGRLLRTLSTKLIEDMSRRIEAVPPSDWTPYDLVIRGRALASRPFSVANRFQAIQCFEQALARDPVSVGARWGIAALLVSNICEGWSQCVEQDTARAEQLLFDVLHDDTDYPEGRAYVGMLRRLQGRLSDSRIELEIAIALAPNSAVATGQLGVTLTFLGQPEAAIPQLEKCLRLAPNDRITPVINSVLGLCKLMLGQIEEAIAFLRKARAANPRLYYTHVFLAAAFGLAGELDEAGDALRQLIEMQPDIGSLSAILGRWQSRSSVEFVTLFEKSVVLGLRRAGLLQAVVH